MYDDEQQSTRTLQRTSGHASGHASGVGTCTGSQICDEDVPNSYTHHDKRTKVAKAQDDDEDYDFSIASLLASSHKKQCYPHSSLAVKSNNQQLSRNSLKVGP